MKFDYRTIGKQKVTIATVEDELAGSGAINLQARLCDFQGNDNPYLLLNLKNTRSIDGLGISVLDQFFTHSKYIRLFNVSQEIRMMFNIAGRDDFLRLIYNVAETDKAFLLFAKEFFRDKGECSIDNRQFPRVTTLFPTMFKYHAGHDGVILGKANILNLSEGGALVGDIETIDSKNRQAVEPLSMEGQGLYDLEFPLRDGKQIIRAKGERVWEIKGINQFRLGIRFTEISRKDREKLRDYTCYDSQKADKENVT
ncbi:MAG: PilZ domain-containing protein [Candidatus Brocadiaceae bacterium]|nr:PilZ domain-containing protein [Candidatus Brocadiaceae bacterium]